MSVTTIISALAPAYANDSRVNTFMQLAMAQTSSARFGVNYEYAVALRVCHMIARNPISGMGVAGPVSSASEGGVSQSYAIPSYMLDKYGDLCSTPYGMQLANLIEGNIFAQSVSTCGSGSNLIASQGNSI